MMEVLSLFDGISCGQLALERAGIKVNNYYASEIEPSAISVTMSNFPKTIQLGDITKLEFKDNNLISEKGTYKTCGIDLVIGGSPCTDFSSIGYSRGMTSENTEITSLKQYMDLKSQNVKFTGQSYLFWEYVRLLKEVKPRYFLLENVVMAKKWQSLISQELGAEPAKINSSIFAAQNRPRLYWTNIPFDFPDARNITLDDIFDASASAEDVSHCQTVQKSFERLQKKYGYIPEKFNAYNASEIKDKAPALSRGSMVTSSCATLVFVPVENGVHHISNGILDEKYSSKLPDGRYNIRRLSLLEMERLQTLPDNYTNVQGVSDTKRSHAIGNGWTVDVIAHILKNIK